MAATNCISTSNGDLIAVQSFVGTVAVGAAGVSDPVQTDTVVATGGAVGVAATLAFALEPRRPINVFRAPIVGTFLWETTVAGGAAATGRLNLVPLVNGVVVTGAVVGTGPTRAFDAIAGPFSETLLTIAPALRLDANDVFAIGVQLEVVVIGAAGNVTVRLRHNPAVAADNFRVELPNRLFPAA